MEPPSNGTEQAMRCADRPAPAVHQHKRARAISILDRPRRKTCLTKERALLFANHSANSNGHSVEMLCCCCAKNTTGIAHIGQEGGWNIEGTKNLAIPSARVDIVQHCPCRIRVICAVQAPATELIE